MPYLIMPLPLTVKMVINFIVTFLNLERAEWPDTDHKLRLNNTLHPLLIILL